jgi:hypothetical protein
MDIQSIKSPTEFASTVREEGFTAPPHMYGVMQKYMRENNATFPSAYYALMQKKTIFLVGRTYFLDLSALNQ